jgi:O-antigen ligase
MALPSFIRAPLDAAIRCPSWGVAYLAALLIPWMLIFARAGIEVCCAIIGLLFLRHCYRTNAWGWLRAPFTLVCFAAWGWLCVVVTPLAEHPEKSAVVALFWIRLPIMFIALRYWVLADAAPRTLLASMLASMLALTAIDTVWQFVHGVSLTGHARIDSGRLTGPFEQPKVGLFITKMLLPALALLLPMLVLKRQRRALAACMGLTLVVLVVTVLSGERSALLTALLGLGTAAGLMVLKYKPLRLPVMLAAISLVAMFAALFVTTPWVQQRSVQGLETMRHYGASDYGQLAQAGIAMGREHWVHGVGLMGFRSLCPELPYQGIVFRGLHPHHMFIEWFAEAGVIGLLFFLAMIGLLLREALQHFVPARGMEALASAATLGILMQHFFPLIGMQSFFLNWSAVLLWYALALAFSALPRAGGARA